ncbi:MAG: hypothetical protein K2H41_01130 [Acetatifactor sp.]|nr:hypothetical protein [Acetatifactor sp.]MDE7112891.1 hypothetical protein [Acetatifactor sp.]
MKPGNGCSKALLFAHFSVEREIPLSEIYKHIDGGHDGLSAALIHHLYANYDAFILLLTKSQGSRFEDAVDGREIFGLNPGCAFGLSPRQSRIYFSVLQSCAQSYRTGKYPILRIPHGKPA